MKPLILHEGHVIPFDYEDVDTDTILPKQFLKRIEKTGYENFLFYNWRFLSDGIKNPDFILNEEIYQDATILLTRENFGNGSSREHAVWGLENYGFKVIIAPSFGEIFYNNCFINGILPIVLSSEDVQLLFDNQKKNQDYRLTIDVEKKILFDQKEFYKKFELNNYRQNMLLKGLDEIGITLETKTDIDNFEKNHKVYYEL